MATYLIFGGVGFIGRNLVTYLLEHGQVQHILVVDKIPPAMAWLNSKHKEAFENSKVTYKSCNLLSPGNIAKLSELDYKFDYVINLAAETKLGLSKAVYEERVHQMSLNCARFACDQEAKLYVELSTAQVYGSNGKLSREDDKAHPRYDFEVCKLNAEKELPKIEGLKYVIIRAGMVYGHGDKLGYITSQLVIASIYKHLNETMKLIWSKNMYVNTVHVTDVCAAVLHLTHAGQCGETYNLVDLGDTTLDTICKYVANIFKIKYDYLGSMVNLLAQMSLKDVAEDVNEKHMIPWSAMCAAGNISNTPLSPFIYSSQLETLNIRASNDKILKTGFTFAHPTITEDLIRDVLDDAIKIEIFPKISAS